VDRLRSSPVPDEVAEATAAGWLLGLDWFELLALADEGARLLRSLAELAAARVGQGTANAAACDAANSAEDEDFIGDVQRGLAGIETLPLERNEVKWADFFVRHRRGSGICVLGVATLFLVAGDITAYAAAAAGGEHLKRLRRSLMFAQGIAQQHVQAAALGEQDFGRLDLLRTQWPLWQLLLSIRADLVAGAAAAVHAALPVAVSPGPFQPPLVAQDARVDSQPYLSVIVQCRNDDYGGGMLTRLNRMLATATLMFHEAGLPVEIILVEWNPPVGRPAIAEVIERAPGTAASVPIRVIRVPSAVHMRLPHHKAHPIFEHIAENVAFRRARGSFLLKTNIDNILSPDTVLFLARRQLREDAVYRATYVEHDVAQPDSEGLGPGPLLEWLFSQPGLLAEANLRLRELLAIYPEDAATCSGGRATAATPPAAKPLYWAGSGDFVLASRALVLHVRGYPQVAQNWQTDDLIHCRFRAAGARQVLLLPPCVTVHQNHRRINRVRSSTRWVVTDANFDEVCGSPFRPLPTETGLGDDWGFASDVFHETVV